MAPAISKTYKNENHGAIHALWDVYSNGLVQEKMWLHC